MKRYLVILFMTILIFGVDFIISNNAYPSNEAKKLKIGVLAPLTGPVSSAGLPHLKGTQLAAEWINEKGITIKGQKYLIELVVEDEKNTTDTAISAATKLVDFHKVKFIVGTISPTLAAAVAPITEKAQVIRSLWHGEGAPIEVNQNTPYTFRVPIVPRDFAPPLLKYHTKAYPSDKKIAFLFIENPAVPALYEYAKNTAEGLGLNVTFFQTYPVTTTDFYPILSKVISSKPNAIYCTALPHLMGGILKSARELGFNGPIYNLSPTSPEVVRNIAGKALADNCIVPAPDVNNINMTPIIKEIKERILERYKECNYDYIRPWDSLWWLIQAIEKAQSLDTSLVAKTWEKMTQIQSTTGMGRMGGLKSYGINHIGILPFAVTKMVKGELEHIGWFTPEIP